MSLDSVVNFLLVDDLEENLLSLEALLRRDGLTTFKATSGAEALELLLRHEFALAFLDVQMPTMDGFELAELMRGTERTRRIPIVFLTAGGADEQRRFQGYETGAVDYLFKPIDSQALKNKAEVFFELERQRQELARQRDELRVSAKQLHDALAQIQAHGDNSPLAIVRFDGDLRLIAWSKGAERMFGWSAAEATEKRPAELGWLHPDSRTAFDCLCAESRGDRQARNVHAMRFLHKDGSVLDCELYNSVLQNSGGELVSLNSQILDVTERRRADETQKLLVGELNHRVKNMLASVQAIATQTLRYNSKPADFASAFSGRIQSLSRAHSLLSDATWHGAQLSDLLQDQLHLGTVDEARLTASGPEVNLTPVLALHFGLILHELCTNANKYGALSCATGRIAVGWSVENGLLHMTWIESGGPAVKAPARRGFGTTLIEQSVKAEGGKAQASYRADGLTWDITLKLPNSSAAVRDAQGRGAQPIRDPGEQPHLVGKPLPSLSGIQLLVIEDEMLVAWDIASVLEDAGAAVIGPAATAEQALNFIEEMPIGAALLDGNLNGCPVDQIAAALTRRNIPFLFISGYGAESLPRAFGKAPILGKPFMPDALVAAVTQLVAPRDDIVQIRR